MGSIAGLVYDDSSSDGAYQPGEPTLAGAVVDLWQGQNLLASHTTGSDGVFAFSDLQEGGYLVKEKSPPGFAPAWPAASLNVGVSAGQCACFVEFSHQPLPTATATATPTVATGSLYLPLILTTDH